jgi:hypothetical protein
MEFDLDMLWQTLIKNVTALETGTGDRRMLAYSVQAGILLLLDHPPEHVLQCVASSGLPEKATVRWLLYEANRIREMDQALVEALRNCWDTIKGPEMGPIDIPGR